MEQMGKWNENMTNEARRKDEDQRIRDNSRRQELRTEKRASFWNFDLFWDHDIWYQEYEKKRRDRRREIAAIKQRSYTEFYDSQVKLSDTVRREAEVGWRQAQDDLYSWHWELTEQDFVHVRSMLEARAKGQRKIDIISLMRHSRISEAGDPRDRVFAFLGLSDRDYEIAAIYDSTNTVVHVLITLAKGMIEKQESLEDVLFNAPDGRQNLGLFLPSWVPDWTSRSTRGRLEDCLGLSPQGAIFKASGDTTAAEPSTLDLEFRKGDTEVNGAAGFAQWELTNRSSIIAGENLREEDEVWILRGASKPVVLRFQWDDEYTLISDACVVKGDLKVDDEIMYGSHFSQHVGNWGTSTIWIL
ncbi:hypothetical protein FKW77_007297 [Venturia effusa]|uniref:Heterokaryon incompatibility domain-containing protein n=1 Tax=Venturia effusa TaxID=50376 RepID=A0A517L7M2_9PEZI|nr:hypothetical protein FKW77_007297 [Venturia effusa]